MKFRNRAQFHFKTIFRLVNMLHMKFAKIRATEKKSIEPMRHFLFSLGFSSVSFICGCARRIQLLISLCESDSSFSVVRVFLLFMRLSYRPNSFGTLYNIHHFAIFFVRLGASPPSSSSRKKSK